MADIDLQIEWPTLGETVSVNSAQILGELGADDVAHAKPCSMSPRQTLQ